MIDNIISNEFFNSLATESISKIDFSKFEFISYKKGDLIIEQDTKGDFMFLIISGEVIIEKVSQNDHVELARRGSNSFVGEMSLFDGKLRSANVIANSMVNGYKVHSETFNYLVNNFDQIKMNVIKIIADSIRDTGIKLGEHNNRYNKDISLKNSELLELKNLLDKTLQLKMDIDEQKCELELINRQLELKNRELNQLSIQDNLTLLYSKTQFMANLKKEFFRSKTYDLHFTLLVMDIDDFNKINSDYGYFTGDLVLKEFSKKLNSLLNTEDTIARICNNQFGIILPHRDICESKATFQRVFNYFYNNDFIINKNRINITVSVGVSDNSISTQDFMDVYNNACKKLELAKKEGKNRFIA